MLCELTLAYFAILTPKVSPNYLQTHFCLLRRPEERIFGVLVYASSSSGEVCLLFGGALT